MQLPASAVELVQAYVLLELSQKSKHKATYCHQKHAAACFFGLLVTFFYIRIARTAAVKIILPLQLPSASGTSPIALAVETL